MGPIASAFKTSVRLVFLRNPSGQPVPAVLIPLSRARIAQLVEQRIENPRVGGSNPSPGTTFHNKINTIDIAQFRLCALHSHRTVLFWV